MISSDFLSQTISEITLAAFEDGRLRRDETRMLVAGLTRRGDAISLWGMSSWENYAEPYDGEEYAQIAIGTWLDEIDELQLRVWNRSSEGDSEHRQRHARGAVDDAIYQATLELSKTVVAALRKVATSENFASWPSLLGFFEHGFGGGDSANLVAIAHPCGGGQLHPIRERRPPSMGIYAEASFTDEGMTIFYIEGEKDGLDDSTEAPQTSLTIRPEDVEMVRRVRRDRDISVRLKGELFDRTFAAGITRDEWGGPTSSEVVERISGFFLGVGEAVFDVAAFPNVDDAKAVDAWMQRYLGANLSEGRRVVRELAQAQGLAAVPAFLSRLPETAKDYAEARAAYAGELLDTGAHAEALGEIALLEGKTRARLGDRELRCLLLAERYDDALARCAELALNDERAERKLAPLRALALSHLGRESEAVALLEPLLEGARSAETPACYYALAHAKRHSDPDAARDLVLRSMAKGDPQAEHAAFDFRDAEELLALYRRREFLDDAGEAFDTQLSSRVAVSSEVALGSEIAEDPGVYFALASQLEVEGASNITALELDGSYAFAVSQTDGLFVLDIANPSSPSVVAHLPSETSFEGAVLRGPLLYVADYSWGVRVVDVSSPESPKDLGVAQRFLPRNHASVTVGEGFVATGGACTLDVYDLSDPEAPVAAACLEIGRKLGSPGNVNALAACGTRLFVAAGGHGLLSIDVSKPTEPRLLSQCGLGEAFYANDLVILGDLAWLSNGSKTLVVDISDPENSSQVGVLPYGFEGNCLSLCDGQYLGVDGDSNVWMVDDPRKGVGRVVRRLDTSDEDRCVDRASCAHWIGDVLLTAHGGEVSAFEQRQARDESAYLEETAQLAASLQAPIATWAQRALETWAEAGAREIGAVQLGRWGDTVRLAAAGAASALSPWESIGGEFCVDGSLAEIAKGIRLPPDELPESIPESRERFLRSREEQIWRATRGAICETLAASEALAKIASGRVFLSSYEERGELIRVIKTFADREWRPARTEVQAVKVKTVRERLLGAHWYKQCDDIAIRASSDSEVFQDVLELASEGLWAGLRTALQVEGHEEEVLAAFIAAAKKGHDARVLEHLGRYKERPEVRAILEEAYQSDSPTIKIPVAVILGRCDEEEIVANVAALLGDEKGDYASAELAAEAMAGMKTRIADLREPLAAWAARAGRWENRLPLIAKHLFRAGHPTLPEALVLQAQQELHGEQYHSVKLGIASMDSWSQHAACEAMRLWTGKALADHVIARMREGDRDTSLYPEGATLERFEASWGYLLASAWPHLERAGATEWFVDGLIARARPGETYEADRLMLLSVLATLFQEGNMAAVVRVAKAILSADEEVYDAATRRRLERKYFLARLQTGWELVKEQRLEEARHIASAALVDQPADGQVLFFDARLRWLESSVDEGIKAAEAHLQKLSVGDAVGRGRLLNLVGCGLDELGRLDEALGWFEKAAQAHPDDPMYLANVAECHHRLGHADDALRYAKSALAQGANSDYARKIVSEA